MQQGVQEVQLHLQCRVCGHEERGSVGAALMTKVRLYNHVSREHPALADRFKEIIGDNRADSNNTFQKKQVAVRH